MARKKKVKIVDEELTPTVLAIRTDKKKTSIFSIVWIIFIFVIFIGGVYYLPELSQYVNNYLNPELPSNTIIDESKTEIVDEEIDEEVIKYNLAESPEIKEDLFTLSNFIVEDNKISFLVTNTSDDIIYLEKYNYFLSLYSSGKKLLQIIMVNDGIIPVGESLTLSFDIEYADMVSLITFINIDIEEYPAHVVNKDENGNAILVCKKDNETVNYLLTDNKVYAIQDIFEVSLSDSNYVLLYSTYQALASTYNAIGGVTSNVTTENDIMYFRTLINLNTFADNAINNKVIYSKDTDAKIMNFELEASGYNCN